jgi:hypothetical protein
MKKAYTDEEAKSLEDVLDMGFFITNSNGDVLISHYGDYEIRFHDGRTREYDTIEKALKAIFKKH